MESSNISRIDKYNYVYQIKNIFQNIVLLRTHDCETNYQGSYHKNYIHKIFIRPKLFKLISGDSV